jgi:Lar family restriction alleviation protein
MSVHLKPCPFCGGERIKAHYIRDGQSLGCQDCGAGVRAYNPNAGDKCIELWNRREAVEHPSARITGDKGRGNLAEGAHYGDGIIGRCLALEERGDLLAVALAEAISDMTAEIEARRNAELPRRIERDLAIVADWKRALDNWRAGR